MLPTNQGDRRARTTTVGRTMVHQIVHPSRLHVTRWCGDVERLVGIYRTNAITSISVRDDRKQGSWDAVGGNLAMLIIASK